MGTSDNRSSGPWVGSPGGENVQWLTGLDSWTKRHTQSLQLKGSVKEAVVRNNFKEIKTPGPQWLQLWGISGHYPLMDLRAPSKRFYKN